MENDGGAAYPSYQSFPFLDKLAYCSTGTKITLV
jgi:hypothetical protein